MADNEQETIEELYCKFKHEVTMQYVDDQKDDINSPARYNQYQIETIEMMRRIWGDDAVRLWAEMTAFKYRMRLGHKDEIEKELAKENWYLNYSKNGK